MDVGEAVVSAGVDAAVSGATAGLNAAGKVYATVKDQAFDGEPDGVEPDRVEGVDQV